MVSNNKLNFYNNLLDEEKKKVGILAPEILDVSINRSYYNIEENISYKKVEHVIQSGSLIKASIFKDIGFFNEKLFIYYVDTEFCFNVRKHRYEIFMVKEAILFHEEGKKERRIFCGLEFTYDNYSNQAIYYISRNSIYMFRKYKKITFIMRIIYDFIKILLAEPKKIKYLFYGIKDGVLKIYGKKSKW